MTMPMFIFGILVNQLQRGGQRPGVFAAVDLDPPSLTARTPLHLRVG